MVKQTERQKREELKILEKLQPYKMKFNDICMRELGLEVVDEDGFEDYIADIDSMSILQFKEKYIKYCDEFNPYLKLNEVEMNLLENSRMMEQLFANFLIKYSMRHNLNIVSTYQSSIQGTDKGLFSYSYLSNGKTIEVKSDPFVFESVRVLNLICKMNKSDHIYNFNIFDDIMKEVQDVLSNK